jgi:tetratricopeptide (TPR) repeat protein
MSKRSRNNVIAVLILAAAVCIAYFNTLPGAFIHDDESKIVDNPYIRSPRYIGKILTSPAWAFEYSEERAGISNYYRPLQYLIYMGIYRICGLNPAGYHLSKLLLHILTTILLFFMLEGYFTNFRTALAAAILFAVHPIHTEAVTWISGITDALVTPFVLCAFILYLKALRGQAGSVPHGRHSGGSRNPVQEDPKLDSRLRGSDIGNGYHGDGPLRPERQRRRAVWHLGSCAFFFVGLFSKETAVILIPLMVLHDALFGRRYLRLKRVAAYLPYALLFLVYLGFRIDAIGSLRVAGYKYEYLDRWQCLLNPVYLAASYFFKALLPINQNGWYVFHPVLWFWDVRFILSLALLLCLVWYAIRLAVRRQMPELFFLLWFFITISPVVVFFRQIGLNVFAERYLYLPGVGFCALLALALDRLKKPRLYYAAVGSLAILYALLSIERNAVWGDRLTFWSATVNASPDASLARNNLGVELYKAKRYREAEAEYREAIRLMYDNPTPHINLAMMYQKSKRYAEAIAECRIALLIRPDYAEAYATLGNIYRAMEDYPAALAEYRNALRARPLDPTTMVSLAALYNKLGDYKDAEDKISEALRLKPEFPEAYAELGVLYDKTGDLEKAAQSFRRALEFKPDFTEARINLGSLYSKKGDVLRALEELQAAVSADPDSAEAHYRLGVLYSSGGRFPDAAREYSAAIGRDNEHVESMSALGALLGMAGKYAEAERLLKKAIEIEPDYADARYNLEVLYRKTGRQDEDE